MNYFLSLKLLGNIKLLMFALTLVMLAIHSSPINAQFADGDGTEGNPYQIISVEQLDSIRYYLDSHFTLNDDMDLSFDTGDSEGQFWNDGEGWAPIGDFNPSGESEIFTGSLNGNGYTISGLNIDRDNMLYIGFFGHISGNDALITDLKLKDIFVEGDQYVGGLVGNNEGKVLNCSVTGVINGIGSDFSGEAAVGGIAGRNQNGIIQGSSFSGTAYSDENFSGAAGGLVGVSFSDSKIIYSNASASVTGKYGVGGLVGNNSNSETEIIGSFAIGKVSGDENVGGLTGMNASGKIINSYAMVNVIGNRNVGSFVGQNYFSGKIDSSYAIGKVSGEERVGGFVGYNNDAVIENSYWNKELSGIDVGIGEGESIGLNGLSSIEMTKQSSYTDWNFDEIWTIDEGETFPWLQNNPQNPPPTYTPPFAGGEGTEQDPYHITSAEQLDSVRYYLHSHFILNNDINLSFDTGDPEGLFWNDGAGWEPLGDNNSSFTGSFDGGIFTIQGLTINRPNQNHVGLFGSVGDNGEINNIGLQMTNIEGNLAVGGVVGRFRSGVITKSYSSGTVTGNSGVGGIIGDTFVKVSIENSYSISIVNGDDRVGGLVGYDSSNVIINSYASGEVIGGSNTGGLIGESVNGTVTNSYWNIETSGQSSSSGGIGLTTNEMVQQSAFSSFDFQDIWVINEGESFPWLENNPQSPPPLAPPNISQLQSPVDNSIDLPTDVTFLWNESERSDSYRFQLSTLDDFSDSEQIEEVLTDTSLNISDLDFGTTYFWRVKTENEAGSIDWSEVWGFTTIVDAPGEISLISPVDNKIIIQNSFSLNWTSSTPEADFYHFELANDAGFTSIVLDSTLSNNSIALSGVEDQKQYFWRVKPENISGEGPYSEEHSFYIALSNLNTDGEIVSGVSQYEQDVYFTSSKDDNVYGFDSSGNTIWEVETGGELLSTVSVDEKGNVYVGSTDTRLYSFDKVGIPRWDGPLGGTILSSPSIGPDGTVYVGISTGRFFAVDQETGEVQWSIQTDDQIISSASIDNENLYFGSNDGKLYAVTTNGDQLWTFETQGAIESSPALTSANDIVVTSTDGSLYKINNSGNLIWEFSTEGAIYSSPVIGADSTIYFGSSDNTVYAISGAGQLLWSYDTGSPVNGTPALTDSNELVIGTEDGRFLVFNNEGELIWSLKTDGSVVAPPLITEDKTMFISSTDGNVYIINGASVLSKFSSNQSISQQQWPTFKGNNQRTGYQGDVITNNQNQENLLPTNFSLSQNYPNPFNPTTQIRYGIPEASEVQLEVYNMLGQRVAGLVNERKDPGWHTATFDASQLSSGIYIYRIRANVFMSTKKLMLIK